VLNQKNKMTEKDYNPEQKMKKVNKALEANAKQKVDKSPVKKEESKDKAPVKEEKKVVVPKVEKKDHAVVNAKSVHVSTKYAMAICKFIKWKEISKAIADLEQVVVKKKAVPMKGEIPHRKGRRMMSGRFPKKGSEQFIILLKSLLSNSNMNGLENPIIVEASSNMAQRPFGRGGIKRKRTHVRLKAMDKQSIKKKVKKTKKEAKK
jgi:ribosomal protein L22